MARRSRTMQAYWSLRPAAVALLLTLLLLALTGCVSAPASSAPQAPAFTLPSAGGGEVSLNDYVGEKPVLLYFHMAVG